jgi:spore germination protein GerM
MGIKPIDLQTLFVKLDDVSREQALVKEQSALQQAQAARLQVAKELAEDRQVTRTPAESEKLAVQDDDPDDGKNRRRRRGAQNRKKEETDSNDREVVTDPDVGRHVDLSG